MPRFAKVCCYRIRITLFKWASNIADICEQCITLQAVSARLISVRNLPAVVASCSGTRAVKRVLCLQYVTAQFVTHAFSSILNLLSEILKIPVASFDVSQKNACNISTVLITAQYVTLYGGYKYDSTSIRRPFNDHSTACQRSLRSQ